MSLREEDKQKNGCPSRGLGLAAAAIGVGVGAALYYFFSKRPENPDSEGATSAQWSCESPQTLRREDFNSSDDYITVSENTTTDTSINQESSDSSLSSIVTITDDTDSTSSSSDADISSSDDSDSSDNPISIHSDDSDHLSEHSQEMDNFNEDFNDWEVQISLELPHVEPPSSSPLRGFVDRFISPRIRKSRERSWSLEECSICFDVILRHHEVMTLPCTHHFHQACILPWLQEQQTCPNCRKNVD